MSETRSALVLADGEKPEVERLLAELEPWLAERLERVTVHKEVHRFTAEDALNKLRKGEIDVTAVRAFAEQPVPTLGINFGRVGFLASTQNTEWREALTEVLAGRGTRELRMRLEVHTSTAEQGECRAVALNDVVLARGAGQGMITVAMRVGSAWATNYRADGLIVATPSGSTAYSLASGGPVLAPSTEAIVVTPISPQALAHRPIVLDTDAELELEITDATGPSTLVVDGEVCGELANGDRLRVTRHPDPYPLLSPPWLDPYKRLRDRLGWRGTVEPNNH